AATLVSRAQRTTLLRSRCTASGTRDSVGRVVALFTFQTAQIFSFPRRISASGFCIVASLTPSRGVGGAPRNVRVRAKHPLGLLSAHHKTRVNALMTRQARRLVVNFREVVHSVRTGNADVAKPQRFAEDRMDTHKNARLTPKGREEMVRAVVDRGMSKAAAARQFNTTPKTVGKWAGRCCAEGVDSL